METGSQRKWIFVGLLAIIVPVGLLVSFRLTGVLNEPSPVETVTVETVRFRMERPTYTIGTDQQIQNYLEDGEISANFTVYAHFYNNFKSGYYAPSDHVGIVVVATASVFQGFIESLYLNYTENSQTARVNFFEEHQLMIYQNLSILEYRDWMRGSWKAFLKAAGENSPTSIYLRKPVDWVLYSSFNQSHRLEMTMTVTYWNLTGHKELILPISLSLQPDSGGFEDATVLTSGLYEGFSHYHEDREDYYKVWLEQSHAVQLEIAYIPFYNRIDFPKVNMYLYDPEYKIRTSDISEANATGQITFTADLTGWWYIPINRASNYTYYLYAYILNISITRG